MKTYTISETFTYVFRAESDDEALRELSRWHDAADDVVIVTQNNETTLTNDEGMEL
jgi:hypothetical protein